MRKPYLIGIAGPSCAGKTCLAGHLATLVPATVFSLDAYYRELAHLSFEERTRFNFDHPDAMDSVLLFQHLEALRQGRAIERPIYDFATHSRAPGSERVQPRQFLIVEGLFTLHWPEVRELFATRVFVEMDDAICLERRQQRDVRERGRTVESVLRQYAETVRPMAEQYVRPSRRHAHVVVAGDRPLQTSAATVLAHVQAALSAAAS